VRKRHRASRDTASWSDNWKNRRHLYDTSLHYNVNPKDTTNDYRVSVLAAFASQAAWEEFPVGPRYIDEIVAESENTEDCDDLLPRQAAERRQAISYMYLYIFCRPPEVDWVRLHVVKAIMLALRIPDGSFGAVKDCLKNIEEQIKQNPNISFNSACKFNKRECRYLIEHGSAEAHIVYEGAASDNQGNSYVNMF
jgi:hypothetical protein